MSAVNKNLPASVGDMGSDLWSRKILHAREQLARAPQLLKPAGLDPVL